MKEALVLIDIQNDFCPGGALEVKSGDEVVPVANRLMPYFDVVVASQDWHPANHGSFAANYPWRKPGQIIQLNGLEQVLWPIHCVQGSFGAELTPELRAEKIDRIFHKGIDPRVDSYSAFFDNGKRRATGMAEYLREQGVEELYIMGLATDYCVKFTVLDALELGFRVNVIVDGCRGIDLREGDVEGALAEMKSRGARLINARDVEEKARCTSESKPN